MIVQLEKEEYHPYYGTYTSKAEHIDVIEGLSAGKIEFIDFINTIPKEKHQYAYADGKWTILEIIQHIIDAERIFAYRALRFARNDKTPIIGFEQDDYVPYSAANNRNINELISDYKITRDCSISLFKSFTKEMLVRIGEASGSPMSVRAVGYVLAGHQKHHIEIIKERYLT
ncbi:DinB family protein [Aquimarina sp. 2201CG1-2-11]|uniref:DinB family protein n=1 Tax=Aquimarina discodermiae TaxID=3231043 RepID=UPI0034625004